MDATQLDFKDNSFDHITSFYTLMFMSAEDQKSAISEAARVLVNGGEVHIWDCDILSAYPEPFCVDVAVQLPDEQISTSYGIVKKDTQDKLSITELCLEAGLILVCQNSSKYGFHLRFKKDRKFQFIEQSSTLLLLAFTSILLPLVTLWKIRFLVLIREYLKLSTFSQKFLWHKAFRHFCLLG